VSPLLAIYAGSLALIAAALAVTRSNVMHSLLYLLAALLALAASFFALGAGFAGALLIIVYAGAIVVLFVFVAMTVGTDGAAMARERAQLERSWPVPAAMSILVAAPFLFGIGDPIPSHATPVAARAVGQLLFGPWAWAIELASFLLLAGLIGVRHIGRDRGEGQDS
jgi:NADH-quinone oxidoreductase subunit J